MAELDPMAPAEAPAPQAPAATEDAAPALPSGPAQMKAFGDAFKDPRALTAIAATYLKNGSNKGLAWLQQAHEAAQENLFEAIGHLDVNDPEGAVAAFNRSGRFNDATGATKNADGTWTINRASGPAVTFNTDQIKRTLLSPQAYFAQQAAQQKAAADAKESEARAKYYDAAAGFQGERAQIERDKLEARETIADLTNQSRELQRQIAAIPGILKATKEETGREFSQKYGLPAFLIEARKTYTQEPMPDPSDPDGKRMLDPSAAALLEALRNRGDLVAYYPDPKNGGIVAVDRQNPKVVLRRFKSADEMRALGIQPDIASAPASPAAAGVGAPKAPPAPTTPAAQGVNPDLARGKAQFGDDVRRVKRFFTGQDDQQQRTASGKIH